MRTVRSRRTVRMSPFRLSVMTEAQRPAVQNFLSRNFSADEPQNRPGWLQWQTENPNGSHIQLCMDGDKIAALSVFLPVTFASQERTLSGGFSVSTMVAPEYRRKGLGKTIHSARLDSFDFALSSGQSSANHQLYMKLGFHTLGTNQFMLTVKSFPRPRIQKRFGHELLSWLKWKTQPAFGRTTLHVQIGDAMPADMPAIFFAERMPADAVICPIHSRAYLQWRYRDHPYFRYQFASVFQGTELLGVGVIRENGTEVFLVDLYCRYSDMSLVVRSLVRNADAKRFYCRFVGARLERVLRQAGCYTHAHGNAYLGHSLDAGLAGLLETQEWCLFMGDSDEDR